MTVEERIKRLEATVQMLLAHIRAVPADLLHGAPGPGEWSATSTLAHVAELLPYWAHEAERIAATPGASLGRALDNPRRLGAVEQHASDTVDTSVPRIRASLQEAVTTLRGLPADAWLRAGQHPTRGTMTVEQMVDAFLIAHTEEHCAQVQATLEALQAHPGQQR